MPLTNVIITVFVITTTTSNCCSTLLLKNNVAVKTNLNTTTFLNLLKQMDFLSLHLKKINESFNSCVDFLLRQEVSPIQLTVGGRWSFTERQRHRAVIVYNVKELEAVVRAFGIRDGMLFCILLYDEREDRLLQLAHRIWHQQGVYKVYYIVREHVLFYNPFKHITDAQYGALINANDMPIEDTLKNLNAYPVRTYIFDSVYSTVFGDPKTRRVTSAIGVDSNIAKLLSQHINFTLELQWPDDEFFGTHLANGSYNGAIGRLIRNETDLVLTGFFVKDYLTRKVEFSVPVYMDKLCCYVMKAKRIPQSIVPLFAVNNDIWFGFFLVGFICAFVWIGFRSLNARLPANVKGQRRLHSKKNIQYMRIFTDTWVVWVRVNIRHFPPFHSERIFVISLCLVSVIFGALLESSLATVYIRPLYYKDMNTLEELNGANLKIYIKHAAMKDDLFFGHNSSIYKNLDEKVFLVAETEERLIDMMSKRGGFAAVTRAASLVLNDIRYFITKKIHRIEECPKNYHIAFVMPKSSPYGDRINILLLRYVQAGIIKHWIEETKNKAKLSIYKYPSYMAEMGDIWKVLTLKDLQLAFYTFTTGSILAALAGIGEQIFKTKFNCAKLRRRFQKLKN